jgi:hypothetical protein
MTNWGATAMLHGRVAVIPELSLTCRLNDEVPVVVGTPVIAPESLPMLSPAGSAPALVAHE